MVNNVFTGYGPVEISGHFYMTPVRWEKADESFEISAQMILG